MLFVLSRLCIRLLTLWFIVFSIFYFYVLGYRYEDNIWFVKASWTYQINYFSNKKENYLILNWNKYYMVNNTLTLYWLQDWFCWYIKIGEFKRYTCVNWNNLQKITYISPSSIQIKQIKLDVFTNLKLIKSNDPFIKYTFYRNDIEFLFSLNWDLLYKDSVSVKKLINLPNSEFVWYNFKWLIFIKDWWMYLLKIKNN